MASESGCILFWPNCCSYATLARGLTTSELTMGRERFANDIRGLTAGPWALFLSARAKVRHVGGASPASGSVVWGSERKHQAGALGVQEQRENIFFFFFFFFFF